MKNTIRFILAVIGLFLFVFFLHRCNKPNGISNSGTEGIKQAQYDAIIVGSGFGGLSCGAYLSSCGYRVLVCEKNSFLGGVCASYEQNGYRFGYGAEDILGLDSYGSVTYLLNKLHLLKEDFFIPNNRRLIDDTISFYIPALPGAFQSVLERDFPEDTEQIRSFFSYAKKVFDEGYDHAMMEQWGVLLPENLWPTLMGKEWADTYKKTHEHYVSWQKKTYQEVLDEYFTDSRIILLLSGLVSYLGKTPVEATASQIVLSSFGSIFDAGYHAIKTPMHFANALAQYIEEKGGTVLKNCRVSKILFSENSVRGVLVGNCEYSAPHVVANVNVKTVFSSMVPEEIAKSSYAEQQKKVEYSRSVVCLHIAVEDPLVRYPTFIQDRLNKTFLYVPSRYDPTLAPQNCSTVIARQLVNVVDYAEKRGDVYEAYIVNTAGMLLNKTIELIPELKDHGKVVRVISPLTYEMLASIPSGATFGYDIENKNQAPFYKTPFPGLYLASASCMGSGVASVIANGLLCAHDIMDWEH